MIALSKDNPRETAHHHARIGLGFTLLADPELAVIRQYGLEHHKAIEFSKVGFSVLGIRLALVPQFKTMAIPTTLLVDESGTIVWIDQTDDYRLRSDPAQVMAAVDDALARDFAHREDFVAIPGNSEAH